MAIDINSALSRKYDILGQQAGAATLGAQAGMVQAQTQQAAERARTPLYAAEAQNQLAQGYAARTNADTQSMLGIAHVPLLGAQTSLTGAQAGLTGTQANLLPQTTTSQLQYDAARTRALNAETSNTLTGTVSPLEAQYGYGLLHNPNARPAFAAGTSDVKGPGGPTEDKVKAQLSPSEAVLNAGAAEHLGRPLIQALNAIGLMKMGMGMVPAKGAENSQPTKDDRTKVQENAQTAGKTGAYAAGTSDVTPQASPQLHSGMGGGWTYTGAGLHTPYENALPTVGGGHPMMSTYHDQPSPATPAGRYAKGTSKAGKGAAPKPKSAKAQPQAQPSDTPTDPSQLDPQALLAALHVGQVGQQLQPGQPMGGMV